MNFRKIQKANSIVHILTIAILLRSFGEYFVEVVTRVYRILRTLLLGYAKPLHISKISVDNLRQSSHCLIVGLISPPGHGTRPYLLLVTAEKT